MTIQAQWIATCDRCLNQFEDGTEYDTRDDLVHDLKGSGWELDEEDVCTKCVRAEQDDRPYAGPIPNPPPPGF